MSKIDLKEIIFFIFLVICSILIPFIEFLNSNSSIIYYIVNKSFFFLLFLITSILLILSYLLYFFTNKKINFKDAIIVVLIFYVFFFQHHTLKFTIISHGKEYILNAAEISFIILLIISGLLSFFVLKNNIILKRFTCIFFVLLFFFNLINFVNTISSLDNKKVSNDKKIVFKDTLNIEKENIYFFILDAMGPIDKFDEHYNLDNDKFLKYVSKKNYNYFYKTKNFYETTDENMSVVFHLDTIYDQNNGNKYNGMYPSILCSNFPEPNLILNLKNLGYQFKWIGNIYAYCSSVNLKYCLQKKNTLFNPELYLAFFRKSPLIHSIMRLGQIVKYDYNRNFLFEDNNGLLKLKKYIKNNNLDFSLNKPTFYFVHHLSPHWPYITDRNCNYTQKYPEEINFEGYKEAYLCNLKRIKEMIKFLEINDPNSFVVFQGDHNWEMSRSGEKKYGDRKAIFSLIKKNDNCKISNSEKKNLNNLNALKSIFRCITGDIIN